jgi:hypothetical protein
MNLIWCGSPFIYSVEYKWTRLEIPQTTKSITEESPSKQKPQLAIKSSDENQEVRWILQVEPKTAVSNKLKRDKKNAKIIASVDSKHAPEVPITRPKQIQDKKLKKGRIKIQRYIHRKKKINIITKLLTKTYQ